MTTGKQQFRILAVGDIVGQEAVAFLEKKLRKFRAERSIDFVAVNGENAAIGNGLDIASAGRILDAGADVITSGNHIWQKKEMHSYLDENESILRPANYPDSAPGMGYGIFDAGGKRVLAVNVMGTVYLDPLACPFETVEKILARNAGKYDYAVLDIHAEATSEKIALANYFDGKFSAIWGTHTHVQTADARILPKGTGYITDLGMTGPRDSVLGVRTDIIIQKMRSHLPAKFEIAQGNIELHGALFTLDRETGKTFSVEIIKSEA